MHALLVGLCKLICGTCCDIHPVFSGSAPAEGDTSGDAADAAGGSASGANRATRRAACRWVPSYLAMFCLQTLLLVQKNSDSFVL